METLVLQPAKNLTKSGLWTGRIISAIIVLFLLVDAIGKIMRESHHVEGTMKAGFSAGMVTPIGIILLVITILYLIPRTAIMGAILLTGYLGGAVAIMILQGINVLFPIIFCALAWAGLYFRNAKLRAIVRNMV